MGCPQEVDPTRHVAGIPRQQLVLFSESLDEYIAADNPVRFIDAFVDSLDLAAPGYPEYGFDKASALRFLAHINVETGA
jgi:hypothetical protein